MKKITLITLFAGLLMITITGCSNESKVKVEKERFSFTLQEGTLTKEKANFILKNNTDNEIEYGQDYWLEEKKNKKWYKKEMIKEFYYDLPLYTLEAKGTIKLEISWKDAYGELSKGTYRVVKQINITATDIKYVASEFVIE